MKFSLTGCAILAAGIVATAGSGALARPADESPPSTEIKKVLNLELRSYALVKKGQVRKSLPPLASAAKLLKTYSAAANQYATTGGGDEAESFARYWGTYESLGNISRLAMQKTDVWKKDVQALALGKQNKLAGEKAAVGRSVTATRHLLSSAYAAEVEFTSGCQVAAQPDTQKFPGFSDWLVQACTVPLGAVEFWSKLPITDKSQAAVFGNNTFQPIDCTVYLQHFLECSVNMQPGTDFAIAIKPPLTVPGAQVVVRVTSPSRDADEAWGFHSP